MSKFKVTRAPISGILMIEPTVYEDARGCFMEYFNRSGFAEAGLDLSFVQANHSSSKKGVVRGLHYQLIPDPMGKLVKAVRGKIFDVGVDIRKGSPTFGKYFSEVLSSSNRKMLYFPPGFAHGFLALEDDTEVIYECTGMYSPKCERGLLWNDPDLGIKWPLDQVSEVLLSAKDPLNPRLKDAETNFIFEA